MHSYNHGFLLNTLKPKSSTYLGTNNTKEDTTQITKIPASLLTMMMIMMKVLISK